MHRAVIDPNTMPCRGPDMPEPRPAEAPLADAKHLSLLDVVLSPNARFTIGQAVKEIATRMGLDEQALVSRMQGEVYWHPGHDALMFVIAAQEIDAVMYVEIPSDHWSFRHAPSATQ